jgi:hypothetical protein
MFSYLVERLKPEVAYGTPSSRQVWFVADIQDPSVMAECMLYVASQTGSEPTFTPVTNLNEFGGVVNRALENLKKAPRIG